MSKIQFFLSTCFITLAIGCGESPTPVVEIESVPEPIIAPNFSTDSAYYYVQKQVDFGPRVPNTPEHDACGEWLASELERHGAEVIVQRARARAFDGKLLELSNIVGQFNPKARSRVLLYAHWDTRPFADKDSTRMDVPIDGANDGGSGVGILLEIARQLSITPAEIGVDIIFFDGEDYGKPNGVQSLQTDLIEAGDNSVALYVKTGKDQEAPHYTLTEHSLGMSIMVARKAWWDELSDEQQLIIQKAWPQANESRRSLRAEAAEDLIKAAQMGITVYELNDEQRQQWKSATQGQVERLAKQVGGRSFELLELIKAGKKEFQSRKLTK